MELKRKYPFKISLSSFHFLWIFICHLKHQLFYLLCFFRSFYNRRYGCLNASSFLWFFLLFIVFLNTFVSHQKHLLFLKTISQYITILYLMSVYYICGKIKKLKHKTSAKLEYLLLNQNIK